MTLYMRKGLTTTRVAEPRS